MRHIIDALTAHPQVSGYKISIHQKESCELFFVKGKLETMRRTDTCDKEVTVYVDHDGCKGDAQFFVYPSTTQAQVTELIDEAVGKALLLTNPAYELPARECGEFEVPSNFSEYDPAELATIISQAVFRANTLEHAALNSVEVFINRHTQRIINSRGLDKTQIRYDAMVEAIPTYNGENQSVELYEQYNFSTMDETAIVRQIAGKLQEVKARYEASVPNCKLSGKVILCQQELAQLFWDIAYDLNYSSVYTHSNLFKKGDAIQKSPQFDRIGITMRGQIPGSVRSSRFDSDGVALDSIRLVQDGMAVNYYGSNRFGQYLNEKPTGVLPCLQVDAGTAKAEEFTAGPSLEIISMSGLQVDFFSDYIGGEIRLAYYNDGSSVTPITGVSISGKLSQVLSSIRLSEETAVYKGYAGPAKAILSGMKIF